MTRYYFLIASQDFLLYQEPIEEILRERLAHYHALNKKVDFCLTTNLFFLNLPDLASMKKTLTKPSVAIISLNPRFINWLKLRIQYGAKGSFVSQPINMFHSLIFAKDVNLP